MRELLPDLIGIGFIIGVLVLCYLGLRLIARDTDKKGKWGINRKIVFCPDCGQQMPKVRIPQSRQQFWWGGWKCRTCGCEMDKWGKKIDIETRSKANKV